MCIRDSIKTIPIYGIRPVPSFVRTDQHDVDTVNSRDHRRTYTVKCRRWIVQTVTRSAPPGRNVATRKTYNLWISNNKEKEDASTKLTQLDDTANIATNEYRRILSLETHMCVQRETSSAAFGGRYPFSRVIFT